MEAIEDASVDTLEVVGASLARAIAAKLDARAFFAAAADAGSGWPHGHLDPFAGAVAVVSILKAIATVQAASID